MKGTAVKRCLEDFLDKSSEARKLSGGERRRVVARTAKGLLLSIPAVLGMTPTKPTPVDVSPQSAVAKTEKEEVPCLSLKIIRQIISYCIGRMPFISISPSYDLEDLSQELFAVALETIRKKHDGRSLGQGSRLFIERRIRGAIIDILRRELPSGGRGASAYAKYEQCLEGCWMELTAEQLAELLGATEATARQILAFGKRQKSSPMNHMIYFDDEIQDEDGAPTTLYEIVADPMAQSPELAALRNEQLDLIRKVIARLDSPQVEALKSVVTDETLKEVGERLSLSESRVHQLKTAALKALRLEAKIIRRQEESQRACCWHT